MAGVGSPEFPQELPLADLYRQGKLQDWLDSMLGMMHDGRACVFSIDLSTGARCVGQVSLVQRGSTGSWNLAFWLHPAYWGCGLAVEAATAAIRHAFAVMRVDEVWAGAARWNERSISTLSRLGLRAVESGPEAGAQRDALNGLHICSLSREQWLQTS